VIGAVCFLAGWLLASVLSPPVASLQSNAESARPEVAAPEAPAAQPYVERLRVRLQEAPKAPMPRRNPFVFGAPTPAAPPAAAPPADGPLASPTMPSGPDFELAGIATSDTSDGLVRTAVISAQGDVLLVKAGDTLPGGFTVGRVDEAAIVVVDDRGRELVLHLK
jgi:hypothetical protein